MFKAGDVSPAVAVLMGIESEPPWGAPGQSKLFPPSGSPCCQQVDLGEVAAMKLLNHVNTRGKWIAEVPTLNPQTASH